jgi:hypothetical protein
VTEPVSARTSAQQREILDAVMAERYRCARLLLNIIGRLGGIVGPAVDHPDRALWTILTDLHDRIRTPWKVRHAARRRRPPFNCGRCGEEGHTAPSKKCPGRQGGTSP